MKYWELGLDERKRGIGLKGNWIIDQENKQRRGRPLFYFL